MGQSGASQSGVPYYVAPIALIEDLVEGATVSGTINGVQVSGTVESRRVDLYVISKASLYQSSGDSPVAKIGYDVDNYKIALRGQPASDLTIHLTQAIPAHKVIIPKEYLDLEIVNGHISYAQMTAETAYQKAETAQSTANTAKTKADAAQSTANTAKTAAETAKTAADEAQSTANTAKTAADEAQSTANTAKTAAETAKTAAKMAVSVEKHIIVLRDSTGTKIQSATWSTVVKGPTMSIFVNTSDGILTDETYATANLSLGPSNPIYKGIEGFPNDSVVGIIYDFNVVNSIPITWGYATKRLNSVNLVPASNNKVIPQRMLILFIQPCTTL